MDLILAILYAFLILIVAPSVIIFIFLWLSNSPQSTKEGSKTEIENKAFEYIKKKYKLHHTITYWSLKGIYEDVDYNDGNLDVEGINLRIEKFGFIVTELEKVIKKAAELKLNITHDMHNDYCAARASVLGAEYALKEMTK
ncbi:hypothetical protein N9600_02015 [Flavobacteriaceae bacterium]|nr:hypothetical protein [Flavobacteriaceae bacterium]